MIGFWGMASFALSSLLYQSVGCSVGWSFGWDEGNTSKSVDFFIFMFPFRLAYANSLPLDERA